MEIVDYWYSVVASGYYNFLTDNVLWALIALAVLGGILAGIMDDVTEDLGERLTVWGVFFFGFPFLVILLSLLVVFFIPALVGLSVFLGFPAGVGYLGLKIYRHVNNFGWRKK